MLRISGKFFVLNARCKNDMTPWGGGSHDKLLPEDSVRVTESPDTNIFFALLLRNPRGVT